MDKMTDDIYRAISGGSNVLLVGPTDSGKTTYVKNDLIPFLQKNHFNPAYFANIDDFNESKNTADIFIIDEIETLIDQDYLENHSNSPKPYYSEKYLEKVKNWHDKLKKITVPSIFILTRNSEDQIENIINNLRVTDWGAKVECFAFKK